MRQIRKEASFKVATSLLCLAFTGLYSLLTSGCSAAKYDVIGFPESSPRLPLKTYEMKQRLWTLGDQFVIKDESQRPVFFVKGEAFSVGDKLSFRDADGNELAYIAQKVFSFRHAYKIYRDQSLLAKVMKKLVLFRNNYVVDVLGQDDYQVRGNFWNYEYIFIRGGRKVAEVSKKFFALSDTYGIAIAPWEDDVLILAAAVVIDQVSHDDPNDNFLHLVRHLSNHLHSSGN